MSLFFHCLYKICNAYHNTAKAILSQSSQGDYQSSELTPFSTALPITQ